MLLMVAILCLLCVDYAVYYNVLFTAHLCCSCLLHVTMFAACYLLLIKYVILMYVLVCSMLLTAHKVLLMFTVLLTAHYLSFKFAMWHSQLITCGFFMFAVCCSLLMGCSYPLCGLQLIAQHMLLSCSYRTLYLSAIANT